MGRNKTELKETLCWFTSSPFCFYAKHESLHWLFGSSFIEQE